MLPEKLSFALASLALIMVVYIADLHRWDWETMIVGMLLAVLGGLLLGRFIGMIAAKELARALGEHHHVADTDSIPKETTKVSPSKKA